MELPNCSYLLIIACLLIFGNVSANPIKGENIKGEVEIGDGTYFIGDTEMNGLDAMRLCESIGMRMISFQTEEKFNTILEFMRNEGLSEIYWTSGRLIDLKGGAWQWTATGQMWDFSKWDPGNILDWYNKDVCITFYVKSGYWNDYGCYSHFRPMCELLQ